jgi:formimidoylglutamate deiminase
MATLSADWVLLADGWAQDTCIEIDGRGFISGVRPGAGPANQHLRGAILPGLPNLHSHAFQRSFAGRTEFAGGGGDFWSWREAMYRAATRVEPDTLAPIAAYLGMQLLRGGFTSLVEFHYLQNGRDGAPYAHRAAMAEAIVEGAQQAGIGLSLLFGIYETGNFDGTTLHGGQRRFRTSPEAALRMLADARVGEGPDLRFGLSPHSLRAVPPSSLAEAVSGLAALDPSAPIHIHVAEQQAELADCLATLGAPPVAWLLENAPVGPNWCLIHATHTTEAEIRAIAASGAVVGLCPSTEGNLGDGIFDLTTCTASGGTFGIGTDSHVSLDGFAELRLLDYSQRLRLQKRNVLAGADAHSGRILWQAACHGGGQAAARRIGVLAEGYRADLCVIEPTAETENLPPDFWLDAAIFASDQPPVRHSMTAGNWVVRDGKHVRQDSIEKAYRNALRKLDA